VRTRESKTERDVDGEGEREREKDCNGEMRIRDFKEGDWSERGGKERERGGMRVSKRRLKEAGF